MSNFNTLISKMLKSAESSLLQRYCLLLWDSCYALKKGVLEEATAQDKKQVKCLILGAQHYQEEVMDYPISRYRDLVKVLKLEQTNSLRPFLFQIQAFNGKARQVKKAYYSDTLLAENIIRPNLVIPESWIIASSLKNKTIQYQQNNRKYICVPNNYKNTVIELNGLLTNREDAYIALVVPQSVECIENDESWLIKELFNGKNIASLWQLILGLYVNYSKQSKQTDWRAFFAGSSIVLVIYLIVISLFLNNSVASLRAESDSLNAQLSPLLDLISQTNESKSRAEKFSGLYQVKGWELTDWQSIAPLFTQGIKLININFLPTGKIALKMRSTSLSSSDVLALLLAQQNVAKADFSGIIQKKANYQDFTIIVELASLQEKTQEVAHD
ncbi:hypothetical protein [Litorilituus lipolyticus]|uniref:Uncharacterized protein n=1 Tax=Litorilituus lipolyticus TaxID=2491017 RepID=A0A502L4W9_9GAMM|nr:hypothetical protein [Litorilituus lipolyticus]TPH18970.1 hypothetical protein EPA86_01350 [Litorilituus lipolyticus]